MARCLRCKAGNEWIEGNVKPERKSEVDMTYILKFNEEGAVKREEHTDRVKLDDRIAELVLLGRCCVVVPKQDESKVQVVGTVGDHNGLILGPARGAKFLQIKPRNRMPRE